MSLEFEVNNSGTSLNATVDQHIRMGAGEWTPQSHHKRKRCCSRCTSCCVWMTSALGVSLLLVLYLTLGAIMFMFLGSISQNGQLGYASNPSKSMNTALLQYDPDGRLLEKTLATVDRLWSITEDLNILYRENWTHLAQLEMRHYQDQIVRTLRKAMLEEKYSFRQTWTFPMSLLYALTLVTTIGYGFYTPTSLLSRSLTIAYSIFGIPLFLLYLSVVGERLGRVITGCCSSKSTLSQGRRGSSREDDDPVAFHYHDVNMAVQPINHQNCNGNSHSLVVEDANEDVLMESIEPHRDTSRTSLSCCVQVPVIVCFLLVIAYIGLGSLLLVVMEDVSFIDGFHLIVNLLLTLGFAQLLPGMNGEHSEAVPVKSTSQLSLLLITFLILFGMTLLSSSFNVLLESRSSKSVTYHHMPSPSRHRTT